MKKSLVLALGLSMVLAFTACGKKEAPVTETQVEEATEAVVEEVEDVVEEAAEEAEEAAVMSYAEYIAADLDSEVTVETYVQGANSWWDNTITVYSQDEDGAYFLYNMACSEEDAAKLVPGTKIRVTGYKSEWSGEVEITDGTFEIIDGNYIASAKDVTDLLGKDELIDSMNQFVSFTGLTVEASTDADGNEAAYLYNWDGSGEEGSDVYFTVSKDGQSYQFLVRSYLTGPGTDVYEAAKNLQTGDTVDMEGFLYWYEGVNPHITKIAVK